MRNVKNIVDCTIGDNTKICDFVNLYGCVIGSNCMIGTFVEIQKGVVIGGNVRIQSHSFICEGVKIEDNVFVGHHVVFTNDKYPKSVKGDGSKMENWDWTMQKVTIEKGASIGSNATIVGPVTIGENALVGAGAVVTKDVPPHVTVVGNPARILSTKK